MLNVVGDGTYLGGIVVTNPIALLSVNGPQLTLINGGAASSRVTLADGASLTGFTITNGSVYGGNGGGVNCASTNRYIVNRVLIGNNVMPGASGIGGGGEGGGVYAGTLYQCILQGNQTLTHWITNIEGMVPAD